MIQTQNYDDISGFQRVGHDRVGEGPGAGAPRFFHLAAETVQGRFERGTQRLKVSRKLRHNRGHGASIPVIELKILRKHRKRWSS